MDNYSEEYYSAQKIGSLESAKEIIPIILDITKPRSVVDVGCGVGQWLSVFKDLGVEEIFGLDGDWVDEKTLNIPATQFKRSDLKKSFSLDRQFDLVMSLEVAEHLPENCAEGFINSLVKLGPVIIFSAAIPHQGGTNHINEQWPEYWEEFFKKNDYLPVDCLRAKIWKNKNIKVWYKQNILLFVNQDYLQNNAPLLREYERSQSRGLSLVHPQQYIWKIEDKNEKKCAWHQKP